MFLVKKSSWPPGILTLKIREIDATVLMPATVSQNFQYETHAMTGNGNYVNLLKLEILTENKKENFKLYAVALFASHRLF